MIVLASAAKSSVDLLSVKGRLSAIQVRTTGGHDMGSRSGAQVSALAASFGLQLASLLSDPRRSTPCAVSSWAPESGIVTAGRNHIVSGIGIAYRYSTGECYCSRCSTCNLQRSSTGPQANK